MVAKLDAEQWSLLGARLTQLEEAAAAAAEAAAEAGKAVGRVRAGVREDIRGASDALAAAAEAAVETPKTGTRRRLGQEEDWDPKGDLPPKAPSDDASKGALPFGLPFEFAERVAVPASEAAAASAFGRIAAEAALSEDSELEGRSRDGLPPINAAVGLTKEAAFENMQALLREKSDETGSDVLRKEKEKAPAVSTSAPAESATRTEEEKEEEEWSARPVRVSLATGRDGRVVATLATRGEKGAESVDEIRTSGFATDDGRRAKPRDSPEVTKKTPKDASTARARLDEGLASLRAARLAARDAGSNPTRMLEADADAAAAVANLEAAAEAFDDRPRPTARRARAGLMHAGPNEKDFERFSPAPAPRAAWATPCWQRAADPMPPALLWRPSRNAARHHPGVYAGGAPPRSRAPRWPHTVPGARRPRVPLALAWRSFEDLATSDSDSDSERARDGPRLEQVREKRGRARGAGWGAALALRGDAALASAARRRRVSRVAACSKTFQTFQTPTRVRGFGPGGGGARGGKLGEGRGARARDWSDSDSDDDDRHFSIFTAETRARAFTDTGATRCVSPRAPTPLAALGGDFGSRVRCPASGAGIRIRVRRSAAAPAGRVLGPRGGVLRRGHAVGRGGDAGKTRGGGSRVRGGWLVMAIFFSRQNLCIDR